MVRDACLIIVTFTMVGMVGWMIASDLRQRRELAGFQERVAQRIAAQWQYPEPPAELGEALW